MRISGNNECNMWLFDVGFDNILHAQASLTLDYIEISADMIIETDNLIGVIYRGKIYEVRHTRIAQ